MSKFSYKTAWWAYNLINQYSEINFQLINADVRGKAREVEDEARQLVAVWEAEADKLLAASPGERGEREAMDFLTARSNQFAEEVLAKWWQLSTELFSKFSRHSVTYNEGPNGVSSVGWQLPAWWLQSPEVGYTTWSGASGPFHGVLLDARKMTSAELFWAARETHTLASVGVSSTQDRGIRYAMLFLMPFLLVFASAATYQLGHRRGCQSIQQDSKGYYILSA
jgi:hypothetical protein